MWIEILKAIAYVAIGVIGAVGAMFWCGLLGTLVKCPAKECASNTGPGGLKGLPGFCTRRSLSLDAHRECEDEQQAVSPP